ncbi:unnamed protein product [Prorocentrum cordatum]|uniref:RNase H type-1 domain-containing protein n=1 Tax=Prorocentrum cordatum TaxID=2364126 RepID=A0ABN9UCL1_9DINO|nr:unnamed protein product [Polarella glacialis]
MLPGCTQLGRAPLTPTRQYACPTTRQALAWLMRTFATPPRRRLFCEGGALSSCGHKSHEFANWRALAADGKVQVIETDASRDHGWSYHLCNSGAVVSGTWPGDSAAQEQFSAADAINYKELWVAVECLRREGVVLRGWRVVFRMDNTCAVHYVSVRYGRLPHLEQLAQCFEDAERASGCWALAAHFPGRFNAVADNGSRGSGFAAAWADDPFRNAVLRKNLFLEVQSRCSATCTLGLFADRRGLSALAAEWRYPELTAFECSLDGHVVWAHPPRALAQACLDFSKSARKARPAIKILLLLPEDAGTP